MKVESSPKQGSYIELKLPKEKWFINCSYNTNRNAITNHLETLSRFLDFHSSSGNNIIILGDLSVGVEELHMNNFCESYCLKSLTKQTYMPCVLRGRQV